MYIVSILIAMMLLMVSLACLWYFAKTLRMIFINSPLLGVVALLFFPIGHIIWYLSNKQTLGVHQQHDFKRFFISYVLLIVTSVAFGLIYFKAVDSTTTVSPTIKVS